MRDMKNYRTTRQGLIAIGLLIAAGCTDTTESNATDTALIHRAEHAFDVADGDTIRCTATPSTELSAEVNRRYSVSPGADVGVLSCTDPYAEGIEASYRVTGGAAEPIPLKQFMAESYPTWIGTYDSSAELPLQFDITVERPDGEAISFSFDTTGR